MDAQISEKDARKREKRRERRQKQKERKREGKALASEASSMKETAVGTVASMQEMPVLEGGFKQLDELLPGDLVRDDPQQLEKNDEERTLEKAQKRKEKNYLRKKAQKEKKMAALAKEATIQGFEKRKVEPTEADNACEHEGLTQTVHLKENKSWKYAAGLGLTIGAGMFVYKLYKLFV